MYHFLVGGHLMKKILIAIVLVAALAALSASVALAETQKINLEGEIIAVDDFNQTITIRTAEDEKFEIHFLEGKFGFTAGDIGALVHVKAKLQDDGTILAIWVKFIDGEDDGEKQDSAYCSGEKETHHPVAIVLANSFDKDVEEIMTHFCDGFGFGQIYLALQTEVITDVDYGVLLGERSGDKGWGEIWKDLGYNGKPKDKGETPPGQGKNNGKDPDKTPPGQDKKEEGDDPEKTPPGQEKNKTKMKKPKKDKNK
jgi:hypothetical protein